MINALCMILFFSMVLFSKSTNYWNLGVAINKKNSHQTRIVQKEIDLNNLVADKALITTNSEGIYTLKTNYFIAPQALNNTETEMIHINEDLNIKSLILNEEYFEAAKQIINLNESDVLEEFDSMEDYYYWNSFIYYNLGNHEAAYENIRNLSSPEDPQILFLSALIFREFNIKESNLILEKIITNFPDNDYANYAKNLMENN